MSTKAQECLRVSEDKGGMCMAVYPFYINTDAEGRRTPIAGGTRKKDGTMSTTVYQRDQGAITTPFKIWQYTDTIDGVFKCITKVYYQGELLKEHITDY